MDVEVDVRKPQPPCPFSRSFHRILCRRSRKQLVRSLSRGMAGRGAQAAGIPGRLWADTRAAVARDGAGRGRPAGDGSEAGRADGARSPTPPVRGAAAAVGVARRGPRPLPNVAPRRPVGRRRRRRTPRPAVRRGRGYFRPRGMEGGVEAGSVCVAGGAVDFLGGWFGFFCSFSFDGCGGGGAGCRAWLLREDGDLQG